MASVQIAWLAVRIGPPPRSAIIAVPLRIDTDLSLTLTAEALSLVPGSLIPDVDRTAGVLYIHVLGVRDSAAVEQFRRDVLALEERIVAAVGSTEEYRRRARRLRPARLRRMGTVDPGPGRRHRRHARRHRRRHRHRGGLHRDATALPVLVVISILGFTGTVSIARFATGGKK